MVKINIALLIWAAAANDAASDDASALLQQIRTRGTPPTECEDNQKDDSNPCILKHCHNGRWMSLGVPCVWCAGESVAPAAGECCPTCVQECEGNEKDDSNPCSVKHCHNGKWLHADIHCGRCEGKEVAPAAGKCCPECVQEELLCEEGAKQMSGSRLCEVETCHHGKWLREDIPGCCSEEGAKSMTGSRPCEVKTCHNGKWLPEAIPGCVQECEGNIDRRSKCATMASAEKCGSKTRRSKRFRKRCAKSCCHALQSNPGVLKLKPEPEAVEVDVPLQYR